VKLRNPVFTNRINHALLIVIVCFFSTSVQAHSQCQRFELTSYITLLGPTGPAVGFAEAILHDGTVINIAAEGELTFTKVEDDGTIHMHVRELDEWGPLGTAIGLDQVKLVPTEIPGEFTLKIKTFIIGENGDMEGAFGHYKGTGTASFNDGTLTHSGRGKLCNLSAQGHD